MPGVNKLSVINNFRMTPANLSAGSRTGKVNGRSYTCAVGAVIDVPEGDAQALEAQGFIQLGTSGPTSQRATYPPNSLSDARIASVPIGSRMVDTSLTKAIIFNGVVWVDAATGAIV